LRVPSPRSRLVAARSRPARRGLIRRGKAVSWFTTTSGRANPTAFPSAAASRASQVTSSAPVPRNCSCLPSDRVNAVTS